ncbi:MAG: VOC family protein [Putridiphycobacter sp.]
MMNFNFIASDDFTLNDFRDVLKLVKSLGAQIVKPAQKVFWGGFSGYFKDLDGHLFEAWN